MEELTRLVIYPKDVQRITGKSYSYARRVFSKIKAKYNKEKEQPLLVTEFCDYMAMSPADVSRFLRD